MRTTGGMLNAVNVWHSHDSVSRPSGVCSESMKTKSIPVFARNFGHSVDGETMAEAYTRRPARRF